jgi:hypothetical protein
MRSSFGVMIIAGLDGGQQRSTLGALEQRLRS